MSKRLPIALSLILLAGVGLLIIESIFGGRAAEAQMSTSTMPILTYPAPMVLEVDESGSVLIRGLVESADEDELTIISWGGTWTVRLREDGTVAANGATTLEDIDEGHFVGAQGNMVAQEDLTIVADFVRDWTTAPLIRPTVIPIPEPLPSTPEPALPTDPASPRNPLY